MTEGVGAHTCKEGGWRPGRMGVHIYDWGGCLEGEGVHICEEGICSMDVWKEGVFIPVRRVGA